MLCMFTAPLVLSAQPKPPVPSDLQRLFFYYADNRSALERALNIVGQGNVEIGRGFALLLGVTDYRNFPAGEQDLHAADVDIDKLEHFLRDQEFFEQIVVLKNSDMNFSNID